MHPGTGSRSAIDLSLCDSSLYADLNWSVSNDLHGSDYFPVFINCPDSKPTDCHFTWKLHKADWTVFTDMCSEELGELGSDLSISDFTSTLHNIASTTIPRNKCKPKKHNTPWFNDECRSAILERKKAPRKVKTFPTAANLEQFKIYRAKARRTIRTARQHSWQTFVSKINSRTPIKKVWKMINKIAGKNNQTSSLSQWSRY